MAWKEPSDAERRLREQLAEHGLSVSWAKIRRWREFGALPWRKQQGVGRGSGSTSGLLPETFVVAEALALATVKKRPLEQAVLHVFTTHSRFGEVFVATSVPLPERAVRRALAWYIVRDDSQPCAVIEKAVESSGGCPDRAMDAALESAHRYFRKLYRQANHRRHRAGTTVSDAPWNLADADGLATFSVATVLGFEEFGADAIVEAVSKSFPELADGYGEQVFAELRKAAREVEREVEGDGESPFFRRPHWPSVQDRVQTMERVEYSTICTVRDVLAVLVEAAPALALARRTGVEDPDVRHVEAVRASNQRTDEYLKRAEAISCHPAARAWKEFTGLLLDVCTAPRRLSTFQQDVTALDPALDDVPGLGRRVLASGACACPAQGSHPHRHGRARPSRAPEPLRRS
ncbi:hypothetical protein GCM10010211_82520 [Streptomyces albospinus]|uniref:Uncharacterized protein n=1 Tax=Streptomyces albospinus TaxID=285515 RepID=A0ABQ2VR28_9ACTN|nr:hypothetical protein [Streptomyces albospinus]GGV02705.1 hypothetical protein GCM10010211_82520 [Streptomyces albospinus]